MQSYSIQKNLLSLVFVFVMPYFSFAQDADVKAIKEWYYTISKELEKCGSTDGESPEENYCGYFVHTISFNVYGESVPGVGENEKTMKFFYESENNELVKISIREEPAGNRVLLQEYVYKDNVLVFYYFYHKENDGSAKNERRLYFKDKKLIKKLEDCSDCEHAYMGTTSPEEILANAKTYAKLLNGLY